LWFVKIGIWGGNEIEYCLDLGGAAANAVKLQSIQFTTIVWSVVTKMSPKATKRTSVINTHFHHHQNLFILKKTNQKKYKFNSNYRQRIKKIVKRKSWYNSNLVAPRVVQHSGRRKIGFFSLFLLLSLI
jgi:hypothetical protein